MTIVDNLALPRRSTVWLYIVVMTGLAIGYVVGHSLPDFSHTLDRQIETDNRVTTALYALCLYVLIKYWRAPYMEDWQSRRYLFIGMALTFACWMVHREFWAEWRAYRDAGDYVTANWMRDNLAWLTSIMQVGIWAGAAVCMAPYVIHRFGVRSWWLPGVLVPTLWVVIFMLASMV
jgi:hypothetical protein